MIGIKKILRVISGVLGYILAFLSGVIVWLFLQDWLRGKDDDLIVYSSTFVILILASLLLSYLSVKSSPAHKTRISSLLLAGITSAFILSNIETLDNTPIKSVIAIILFFILCLSTTIIFFKAERNSSGRNLILLATVSMFFIIFVVYDYQYSIFDKSYRKLSSEINYEKLYIEKGKCFPTLGNQDVSLLNEYVDDLDSRIKSINEYLPEKVRNEDLKIIIEDKAQLAGLKIKRITTERRNTDFYNYIDILIKAKGEMISNSTFKKSISNNNLLFRWIRYPGVEIKNSFKDYDKDFNFVLRTYVYDNAFYPSEKSWTYTCSSLVMKQPYWPLSLMLIKQREKYTALCNKKWENEEYAEKMIQAVHKRKYLIDKLEVFNIIRKSINDNSKVVSDIDMPLCPLVRNR